MHASLGHAPWHLDHAHHLARSRLEGIVSNRNAPQKYVWRAEIVLLSADGTGKVDIMRRTGSRRPVFGAGRNASPKRVSTW